MLGAEARVRAVVATWAEEALTIWQQPGQLQPVDGGDRSREVTGESDQVKPGKPHGRERRRRGSGGVVGGCNGGRGGGGMAESVASSVTICPAARTQEEQPATMLSVNAWGCAWGCAWVRAHVCVCFSLTQPRGRGRTSMCQIYMIYCAHANSKRETTSAELSSQQYGKGNF